MIPTEARQTPKERINERLRKQKEKEAELWREFMLSLNNSNSVVLMSGALKMADIYVEEYNKRFKAD